MGVRERFLARVDIARAHECWPWKGGVRDNGYGMFAVKVGKRWTQTTAHRIAYELYCGEIPADYEVDHLCHNRACVNPSHLEAVTVAENRRRRVARKTHCVNGHEYTPENTRTWVDTDGYKCRYCRECQRQYKRAA